MPAAKKCQEKVDHGMCLFVAGEYMPSQIRMCRSAREDKPSRSSITRLGNVPSLR